MWKEFFSFVSPNRLRGVAGVSNVGNTGNWCGHPFSAANWYAFGRLAWSPELSSREIAQEWLLMTFEESANRYFLNSMTSVMERSREMCVDYMMPLGLHHIFKFDHHYGRNLMAIVPITLWSGAWSITTRPTVLASASTEPRTAAML